MIRMVARDAKSGWFTRVRLGAVLLCLAAVLLLVPMPTGSRWLGRLLDLAHAPLFAGLAGALGLSLPRPRRRGRSLAGVWCGLVAFGAVTEWLQGFTLRQSSLHDLVANILGSSAGTLGAGASATGGRARWVAGILGGVSLLAGVVPGVPGLVDCVHQASDFPVLASLERPFELTRWTSQECRISRSREWSSSGQWSLLMEMRPGTYPGAALEEPSKDWTGFETLAMDLHLADGPAVDLVIKVYDVEHNFDSSDRFHEVVHLEPGKTTSVSIPLARIEQAPAARRMVLSRIKFVQLFATNLTEPRRVFLDRMRLERAGDEPRTQRRQNAGRVEGLPRRASIRDVPPDADSGRSPGGARTQDVPLAASRDLAKIVWARSGPTDTTSTGRPTSSVSRFR